MTFMLPLLLVATAAEPPLLQCVDTPEFNCTTGVYTGPPETQLYQQHLALLPTYYAAYWNCTWQKLSQHADFGTADGPTAMAALLATKMECQSAKESADTAFDALIAQQARYGDQTNRDRLRDVARNDGTTLFLFSAAGRANQRAELTQMMEAAARHAAEDTHAPNP